MFVYLLLLFIILIAWFCVSKLVNIDYYYLNKIKLNKNIDGWD